MQTIMEWSKTYHSSVLDWLIKTVFGEEFLLKKTVGELAWGYTDPLLQRLHKWLPSIFPSDQVGYFLGQNTYYKAMFVHFWVSGLL